jgi:hypothetical protein
VNPSAGSASPIGAPALRGGELLAWCEKLVDEMFDERLAGQGSVGAGS